MVWWELRIDPVFRAMIEPLDTRLFLEGAAGIQEDGNETPRQPWDTGPVPPPPRKVVLIAWFEDPDRDRIEDAVREVQGIRKHVLTWSEVPDTDWEAVFRASFHPIRISDRLTVAPPWDAPPGALIIEPGQGFGTGDHPTTRQALVAIDALMAAEPIRTVLDVGCGSGILTLAAAKLGADATGVDVEREAIAEAERSADRNDLVADLSTRPVQSLRTPADLLVANLHAELIVELAPELLRLSKRWLVLAGILADREHLVAEALGLTPTHREVDGEWVSWRIRR